MRIDRTLLAGLLAEAAASPQEEICGLLFGDDRAITAARSTPNVAVDRCRSFEVDPRCLIAAHRDARVGGPRLIGHYHSHPGGQPIPSSADRAAAEPGPLWLIIGEGAARLWRARNDGFTEESIELA